MFNSEMSSKLIENIPTTELLHADNIIIVSNRGPIEYILHDDTTMTYSRGPGGMVTALTSMGNQIDSIWIALAMTEGDRLVFSKTQEKSNTIFSSPMNAKKMRLHYVIVQEDNFNRYRQMTTEVLWLLQHYMYNQIDEDGSNYNITDAWEQGYLPINQAIADAIRTEIAQVQTKTVVMLHDADFCLVSSIIKQSHPSVVIQQFMHLPWPDIRYWYLLPSKIIHNIFAGLVGNDIIGFQTERDARNFLDGAGSVLKGSTIDIEARTIWWHGHHTQVRTYPISISVTEERLICQSNEAKEEIEKLRPLLSKNIIMRVDRLDPIKNIIRGFHAYAQMLDEHPELQENVYFLAFLVPTRETISMYATYRAKVLQLVTEINQKYGLGDWQPIHLFLGNHRIRALAALQFYDVLLVNSIFDGMNLVAKEGVVINQRNGILVLSRTTGAFFQLEETVFPISPTQTGETAHALYKALTLSLTERILLAQKAMKEVERHNVNEWIALQIRDINKLLEDLERSPKSV